VTELQDQLEQLRQNGADSFDPVQFRFIEVMARRASEQTDSRPDEAVAAVIERKAVAAVQHYKQELSDKIDGEQGSTLHPVEGDPGSSTLQLLKALNNSIARKDTALHPAEPANRELKSTRLLRQTLSRIGSQKRINLAREEAPEDSGPLNPQMLAIRSLSTMQDISPAYLNRFISYVDTLFWLEQAER